MLSGRIKTATEKLLSLQVGSFEIQKEWSNNPQIQQSIFKLSKNISNTNTSIVQTQTL